MDTADLITIDPAILGGTPVFRGTRVPVKSLFDYLEDNYTLDECVPWPMSKILVGHECVASQRRGWGGIKNGELLRLAEAEFDLFINLRYQQNMADFKIAILQLSTNKLRPIMAASALVQSTVELMKSGEFKQLRIP